MFILVSSQYIPLSNELRIHNSCIFLISERFIKFDSLDTLYRLSTSVKNAMYSYVIFLSSAVFTLPRYCFYGKSMYTY